MADNYDLTIEIGETKLKPMFMMVGEKLTFNDGPRTFTYPSSAMLYNRTMEPIPNGGRALGLLSFSLENVSPSEIQRAGTVFTLTCRDVMGNETATRLRWPVVTTGFSPVPGLEQ